MQDKRPMKEKISKGWWDDFQDFLERPTRKKLRDITSKNNLGELDEFEFKEEWIRFPKVAKHCLAIANTHGGCIVFGIKEKNDKTLVPIGLTEVMDKADFDNGLRGFLPNTLKPELLKMEYDRDSNLEGKIFQIVFVPNIPECLPFICCRDGDGVQEGDIYVRRATSSVKASYHELQELINRRIKAGFEVTELEKHLRQLKLLYCNKPSEWLKTVGVLSGLKMNLGSLSEYHNFLDNCIKEKEELIKTLLQLENTEIE